VRATVATFVEDFMHEGPSVVAANIAHRAGATGVSIAAAYHDARDVFPHDPLHRVRFAEAGTVLFHPDPELYRGLRVQPRLAQVARDRDAFRDCCAAARDEGLDVTAWTVFLHTDRGAELAELAPENAFGDRYLTDLCPARPEVHDFAVALATDVAGTGASVVDAESLHHAPFRHGYHHERNFVPIGEAAAFLLSLCFCAACAQLAEERGVDAARVRAEVRHQLDAWMAGAAEPPLRRAAIGELAGGELAGYLAARADAVTALVADVSDAVQERGARLNFCDLSGALKGYTDGAATGETAAETSWTLGVDLPRIAATGARIGALGYAADAERLRADLDDYARLLPGRSWALTLRPMLPDTPSAAALRQKVQVAAEFPVEELSFYHYGMAPLEALDWIRTALGR